MGKLLWLKRWRNESYKDLYRHMHGDEREYQDKGCKREYAFLSSICSMWASESKRLGPLLQEAQDLLKEHGLETQSMKASREVLLKYGMSK